MSYLQVSTVLTGKHEVHRIDHANPRVESERAVNRIALRRRVPVMIMRDMWPVAVPKVHHLGPILRWQIFPREDLTAGKDNLLAMHAAELGVSVQGGSSPGHNALHFLAAIGESVLL